MTNKVIGLGQINKELEMSTKQTAQENTAKTI